MDRLILTDAQWAKLEPHCRGKGKVEGLVKFSRANFMVPIAVTASFDDLNARLEAQCRRRQGDHAGRHAETIGERLVADIAALRNLPVVPLEPCEKRAARVSSTALVRYPHLPRLAVPTTRAADYAALVPGMAA